MNDNVLPRVQNVLTKGVMGAIMLPATATPDATAAACALYLALTKMGKAVTLASANVPSYEVTGIEKIQNTLTAAGDNLLISFPYSEGAIDKVDYQIQGNYFNLIIAPRPGYQKLNPKDIKYSYTGGKLDFVITIDAPSFNSLGSIYSENQNQFQGRDIINIDRHLTNAFFGTINYVEKTASSVSELVFKLIQSLQIEVDRDIATNLYAGIAAATNNFTSYSVNANTFETIAQLLRLGAVKKTIKKELVVSENRTTVRTIPQTFNNPPSARPFSEKQTVTPIEDVEKGEDMNTSQAPTDWLKPKIFRGGTGGMI